jgi:hypothetical protein
MDWIEVKTETHQIKNCITGTQGLKGNYERSIIPKQLCIDIVKATEQKLMLYGVSKSF